MKLMLKKYWGFTLIEILLVTIIIWIIFPLMISIYTFIIKANKEFMARESAIQQWYELFEKINILMQDYTIDYEEYYNRQMVWCVDWWWTGSNFTWNISTWWYCTVFTAYWNHNSTNRRGLDSTKYHDIYRCSSLEENLWNKGLQRIVKNNTCWMQGTQQSFGQYKYLFEDIKDTMNDYDDEDLWRTLNPNVNAIEDENSIQELYLISHDWKSRLFFRRKLFTWNDVQSQYKIQILRLRWFDAWQKHSFDEPNNEWLYDWQIDTWACDTSMWFEPNDAQSITSVGWAYSGYYLPANVDDCWVDLTQWSTNIYAWNLSISPQWDPDLFWAEESHQINPYMKIFVVNGIYLPQISSGSLGSSILDFKIPLETTIDMKDFYKE